MAQRLPSLLHVLHGGVLLERQILIIVELLRVQVVIISYLRCGPCLFESAFVRHRGRCVLRIILLSDDPAVRLRLLGIQARAVHLVDLLEHLLVVVCSGLVHVDSTVQVLVHPGLHLRIHVR